MFGIPACVLSTQASKPASTPASKQARTNIDQTSLSNHPKMGPKIDFGGVLWGEVWRGLGWSWVGLGPQDWLWWNTVIRWPFVGPLGRYILRVQNKNVWMAIDEKMFVPAFGSFLDWLFKDFGEVFGIKFDALGRRISESTQTVNILQNIAFACKNWYYQVATNMNILSSTLRFSIFSITI